MGRLFLSVQKLPQGIIHGIDLCRNLVPLENSPVCDVAATMGKGVLADEPYERKGEAE